VIQIRRATIDDASLLACMNATVQQLHADARPDIFKLPVVSDELISWFESILHEASIHIFIGELDGEAIGYLVAKIVHRPENPFTYPMDYLLIDQISVNVDHQGRGCGKKLLDVVCELALAENLKRITLNVWNFNTHAVEFYRSQGFRVFDERLEMELK
jgi:ribosomal protein S18 acetylase RimI-like enzyme